MKTGITVVNLLLLLLFSLPISATEKLESFITALELKELSRESSVVIIDARSSSEYLAGHIPSAINIPGSSWRTAKVKPGEGESQYIFRDSRGQPDVSRYEALLSNAGVSNSDTIVVYGNHAGKADGSIPALLLRWLGHKKVYFLDGVGVEQWKKAGFDLSSESVVLEKSKYTASVRPNFIWNLAEVKENLSKDSVIFYDTRSSEEFLGVDARSNARAGHIPGAVQLDYKNLLDGEKRVLSANAARQLHEKLGITKDKTIVLYCQTATRVSLPALALFDLGYENIAIYDASWHEYGNRKDTKIAGSGQQTARID